MLKRNQEEQKEYRESVYNGQEIRLDYIKSMEDALEKLENAERNRIKFLKEIILDQLNKEKKLNLSRGVNIEEAIKSVMQIPDEKEISDLITRMEPKSKVVEEIKYEKVQCINENLIKKYDKHCMTQKNPLGFDIASAQQSIETGVSDRVDKDTQDITKTLNKLIATCWEGKTNLSSPDIDQFKQIVAKETGRTLFCHCLNKYRKQGKFSMSPLAFASLAKLLREFMDYIKTYEDINNALSIIILSETYYTEQDDQKGSLTKIYIQQGISGHEYFKEENFWKKVIALPLDRGEIQEEDPDESEEEKKYRESNEIFARLGTYAHNMLQFNIEKEMVEKIIFEYAESKGLSKQYMDVIQVWF